MVTSLEVLAIEVASVRWQINSIAERLHQHADAATATSRTLELNLLNAIGHAHAASLLLGMGVEVAIGCARRPAPSGLTDEDLAQAQEATSRALRADAWIECDDDRDDTQVAQAIERWHVEHDLTVPPPPDSEFQNATWQIPSGTSMSQHPYRPLAEMLLVEMPNRRVYLIDIDRSNVCGCGECCSRPSYSARGARG